MSSWTKDILTGLTIAGSLSLWTSRSIAMKSLIVHALRGDDHKIKKNKSSKKNSKPRIISEKLLEQSTQAERQITSISASLAHRSGRDITQLSPHEQELFNKLVIAQRVYFRSSQEILEILRAAVEDDVDDADDAAASDQMDVKTASNAAGRVDDAVAAGPQRTQTRSCWQECMSELATWLMPKIKDAVKEVVRDVIIELALTAVLGEWYADQYHKMRYCHGLWTE